MTKNFLSSTYFFMGYLPVSLYKNTTLVSSPEVITRNLLFSGEDLIFDDYAINSKFADSDLSLSTGIINYSGPVAAINLSLRDPNRRREAKYINLSKPRKLKEKADTLIRKRRSGRAFTGEKNLTMEDLSTILHVSYGITNETEMELSGEYLNFNWHSAPSGGALYPIDIFLLIQSVEGIAKGVYKYDYINHRLEIIELSDNMIEEKSLNLEMDFCTTNLASENIDVFAMYVYNMNSNIRKYGKFGMVLGSIEIGSISYLAHMASTSLDVQSCDLGGFNKRKLENMIQVDGLSRHLLHLTALGR